jgi:hypothetical protein
LGPGCLLRGMIGVVGPGSWWRWGVYYGKRPSGR